MTATKKAIISPLFFALLLFNLFLPVLAAVIFSDGFESGDFSEWTGIVTDSGNTAEVTTTDPYDGTYHARFKNDGSGNQAYAYKTITSASEVYIRQYVRFVSPTTTNDDDTFCLSLRGTDWQAIAGIEYYSATGKYKWELLNRGSSARSASEFTLNTATYYCIEIRYKVHASEGAAEMWVDGVKVISETGVNTSAYGNITQIRIGMDYRALDEIYVDSVVVADAYIGPEEEGQNITEVFEESAGVDYSIIDQKEKLIGCDESMTFHIELTTQKEQGISMIETIYQSPTITAVLYTSLDGEYGEIEMIYAIAALALIVALIGVALIIVHR